MDDRMKNDIKVQRTIKNLTQLDLARLCGVSRQTINAIENDRYDPSISLAFELAKALDVTVDQLFNPE